MKITSTIAPGLAYALCLYLFMGSVKAQQIPARWDELTATDWPKALEESSRTCILPIGILEKHGPHVPIGSDLIHAREWAARATKQEYAVVFPDYFYGQINEAKHQFGTFSLPSHLVLELLDSTCSEIARNGFTKIIIINGHGGNVSMLEYFVQTQLELRRNYAVYFFQPQQDSAYQADYKKLHKSAPAGDMHAGERETSVLLYLRPDLVKMELAANESGKSEDRLHVPAYTAIWWYADFPNHYAGEGAKASKELGQMVVNFEVNALVKALKVIKADTSTLQLQNEYFDRVEGLGKNP